MGESRYNDDDIYYQEERERQKDTLILMRKLRKIPHQVIIYST